MAKLMGSRVVLKRGDGATPTEAFAAVANVRGLRGPTMSAGTVDVTDFDSTDNYREFLGTLKDAGTVSFTIHFDPSVTSHDKLKDDFDDQELHNYRIEFPTDPVTTVTVACIVTGYEVTSELESVVQANLTLKVSGAPTWA